MLTFTDSSYLESFYASYVVSKLDQYRNFIVVAVDMNAYTVLLQYKTSKRLDSLEARIPSRLFRVASPREPHLFGILFRLQPIPPQNGQQDADHSSSDSARPQRSSLRLGRRSLPRPHSHHSSLSKLRSSRSERRRHLRRVYVGSRSLSHADSSAPRCNHYNSLISCCSISSAG